MIQSNLTIINQLGLHARAAAKLATMAGRFTAKITLSIGGKEVDCKSVIALMLLAASKGTDVCLSCEGEDEHSAHERITQLINNRFGEDK